MDVAQALLTIINSDAGLRTAFAGRVYADHLPQAIQALPMCVLWVVSEDAWESLEGPVKIEQARIEVDVLGKNRAESADLRIKVRNALCPYSGRVQGLWIRSISQATGGRFFEDPPEAGTQQYRFIVSQDFNVTYCSEV